MAKKPRRPDRPAQLEGLTPQREQHDRITRAADTLLDERGEISRPYRVHSPLDRLVQRGAITKREREAGEEFQRLYRISALHPLRAADLMQEVRYQVAHQPHGSDRARAARDDAMDALGGHTSPCGSCAWFVLGEELSLREWALREGWSGRPLREEVAKGILVGALGVLAEHFRL